MIFATRYILPAYTDDGSIHSPEADESLAYISGCRGSPLVHRYREDREPCWAAGGAAAGNYQARRPNTSRRPASVDLRERHGAAADRQAILSVGSKVTFVGTHADAAGINARFQ